MPELASCARAGGGGGGAPAVAAALPPAPDGCAGWFAMSRSVFLMTSHGHGQGKLESVDWIGELRTAESKRDGEISMRGSASTTVLLLCLTLVGRSVSQESYSGETCSAEQDG